MDGAHRLHAVPHGDALMAPVPRLFCKDVDGVVHFVSHDPYTDDLKVCCGRRFFWGDRSRFGVYLSRDYVSDSSGPATCMGCIACEGER